MSSKPLAFLITPFTPDRAGGEDSRVFDAVRNLITDAAAAADVDLIKPTAIAAAGPIIDQVRANIGRSDVVLAVLTGQNANIFYELGIALETARRPAILIVHGPEDVPFDIRHCRYWTYGGAGEFAQLSRNLELAIRETLKLPLSISALERNVAKALVVFLKDRRVLFTPWQGWGEQPICSRWRPARVSRLRKGRWLYDHSR